MHTRKKHVWRTRNMYTPTALLLSFMLIVHAPSVAKAHTTTEETQLPPSKVAGEYNLQNTAAEKWQEPVNSFYDGGVTDYYLITTNPARSGITKISYKGGTYPITQVFVTDDLQQAVPNGETRSLLHWQGKENVTIFFDPGSYRDTMPTNYTNFDHRGNSYIGLAKDSTGQPATTITRAPRTDTGPLEQYVKDTVERYTISKPDQYYENLIFDGENHDLYPVGGGWFGPKVPKHRGEYVFYVTSNSENLVMRDIVIQNVGATNDGPQGLFTDQRRVRKNVGINFYRSIGPHHLENIVFKNIATQGKYGVVQLNESTNNFFKNITVDNTRMNTNAYSVKVESMRTTGNLTVPIPENNPVFDGVTVAATGTASAIYVQDYRFRSVNVDPSFRYAKYAIGNGNTFKASSLIFKDPPPITAGSAVLDLQDNHWLVRDGDPVTTSQQIHDTLEVIAQANENGTNVPAANIKLVARPETATNAAGQISWFDIKPATTAPNMPVNIIAVPNLTANVTDSTLVPVDGTIRDNPADPPEDRGWMIRATSGSQVTLHNFDFAKIAGWTIKRSHEGIKPAEINPTDPLETTGTANPDYPVYASYAGTKSRDALLRDIHLNNCHNCRYVSLVKELTPIQLPPVRVGEAVTASTQAVQETPAPGAATNTGIDDPNITWYSSDPTIASIDPATGTITGHREGTVRIYAKANDKYNSGELERPYMSTTITVGPAAPPEPPAQTPQTSDVNRKPATKQAAYKTATVTLANTGNPANTSIYTILAALAITLGGSALATRKRNPYSRR